VAPLTTNLKNSGVRLKLDATESVVMLDRITTMEKGQLSKFIGKLDNERAMEVAAVLNDQFVPDSFLPKPISHKFVRNEAVPFEEDRRYKFKEITSARPTNPIKNAADEYAVAFLNSEGGRIFWGIRDSGRVVVGVKLSAAERDEIRKDVTSTLAAIQPQVDIVTLRITFHEVFENQVPVPDLYVVELSVPSGEPATMHFTSGGEAFVRLDGVKQKLKGPQIQQWIMGRNRAAGAPPTAAERKRNEILAWKGKLVTLSIMNTGRAVMLVGPVAGTSAVQIVDCTEFYVKISMNDSQRSIALGNVDISFDDNNQRLDLQERHA